MWNMGHNLMKWRSHAYCTTDLTNVQLQIIEAQNNIVKVQHNFLIRAICLIHICNLHMHACYKHNLQIWTKQTSCVRSYYGKFTVCSWSLQLRTLDVHCTLHRSPPLTALSESWIHNIQIANKLACTLLNSELCKILQV